MNDKGIQHLSEAVDSIIKMLLWAIRVHGWRCLKDLPKMVLAAIYLRRLRREFAAVMAAIDAGEAACARAGARERPARNGSLRRWVRGPSRRRANGCGRWRGVPCRPIARAPPSRRPAPRCRRPGCEPAAAGFRREAAIFRARTRQPPVASGPMSVSATSAGPGSDCVDFRYDIVTKIRGRAGGGYSQWAAGYPPPRPPPPSRGRET